MYSSVFIWSPSEHRVPSEVAFGEYAPFDLRQRVSVLIEHLVRLERGAGELERLEIARLRTL
jgi:hypothetical protein